MPDALRPFPIEITDEGTGLEEPRMGYQLYY